MSSRNQDDKWKRLKQYRKRIYLSELPPGAKYVAITLSIFMDEDLHAFPSQELVSLLSGIHVRTVRRHIALLVSIGWLDKEPSSGSGKGWRKNAYWGFVPNLKPEQKIDLKEMKLEKLNIGTFEPIKRKDIMSKGEDTVPH